MIPCSFAEFYKAVHGRLPFRWQIRLAERVLSQGWPEQINLPTASGKTSVLDVAVFALACQAGLPALERTAPLRIFFVIDRRLVVDEVTTHAHKLAAVLDKAVNGEGGSPGLREVAQRLRCFAGTGTPLAVASMRGGMYRNDTWAERPDQPLICATTIDQVGSRLLFRGYGLSEYRRPIHAGLIGCDALFIIDEAHLADPFCATLRAVAAQQAEVAHPVAPPLRVVRMSATLGTTEGSFGLTDEDWQDEELARRFTASKVAVLMEEAAFEQAMVEQALKLAQEDAVQVVGVIVNRVNSARQIYERINRQFPGQAILLTGRNRPYERDRLLDDYGSRLQVGKERSATKEDTLFVCATQTIEVGANLDFDALVTEAAPLSALRQRFGRLNRLGLRLNKTPAVIMRRKGTKKEDPVYGPDLDHTWEWLVAQAQVETVGRSKRRVIDFGVQALAHLLAEAPGPEEARAYCPLLLPAYLDLWSQTSPEPFPSPDVAPFLHGPDTRASADVQVVWRADLNEVEKPHGWAENVSLAVPALREALPVPVWAARRWLKDLDGAGDVPDVFDHVAPEQQRTKERGRPALRWRGPNQSEVVHADAIAPGDTLVVPASYGGADRFGWNPEERAEVQDIGNECAVEVAAHAAGRRRLVHWRLHPQLVQADEALWKQLQEGLQAVPVNGASDLHTAVDALLDGLLVHEPDSQLLRWLREAPGRSITPYPSQGVVLTALLPEGWDRPSPLEAIPIETDDDEVPLGTGRLAAHLQGVAALCREFAKGAGLAPDLVSDLVLAGEAHDLGKLDSRFQLLLHGGDLLAAVTAVEPLAKSGMRLDLAAQRRVRTASGYPPGARHEFLGVALLESQPVDLGMRDMDLVLHVVGTHHGRGRPWAPVVEDREPEIVSCQFRGVTLEASTNHGLWRVDSGWVDRYWRLIRRYGHWGLAYLEAMLRLADIAYSRREQEGGELT